MAHQSRACQRQIWWQDLRVGVVAGVNVGGGSGGGVSGGGGCGGGGGRRCYDGGGDGGGGGDGCCGGRGGDGWLPATDARARVRVLVEPKIYGL